MNFSMFRGDSKILQITIKDLAGQPVSLAGLQSARWAMAPKITSAPVLTKSLGSGILIASESGGVLEVTLLPTDTQNLSGSYYHELEIIDVSGKVSTILTGNIEIVNDLIPPL